MKTLVRTLWFQVLVVGLVLFVAAEQSLRMTSNRILLPTVLLLGAFVIPAAVVTYFNSEAAFVDRVMHGGLPNAALLTCFFAGGGLGVALSGVMEFHTLKSLSVASLFGVGLIEESAKLIAPMVLFILWRHRSEADGLVLGVSTGMGFAALETMGYGLSAFLDSNGHVGTTETVILVRGLLAPVGHAAWTGVICAVLWRERERTGRRFGWMAAGAFALAVVLHAVWDIASVSERPLVIGLVYAGVGGASLGMLGMRIRGARQNARASMRRPSLA